MADTEYKIKATLDASGVQSGVREVERAIDRISPRGGGGGNGATTGGGVPRGGMPRTQEAPQSVDDAWGRLGWRQRTSMALGGAMAGGELASAGARALGYSGAAKGIDSTLGSARQLGAMLAPLGPQAAAVGAGLGALGGAVSALTAAMVDERKRLDAATAAGKNMRADTIITRRDLAAMAPEERAQEQSRLRKMSADAQTRMAVGADVAWGDIRQLAAMDPTQARELLRYQQTKTGWKETPPEMQALAHALDYKNLKTQKAEIDSYTPQSWSERRRLNSMRSDNKRKMDMAETMPEIIEMVMTGADAWDPQLDLIEKKIKNGKPRSPSLRGGNAGGVDAMQSMGIGVVANPMRHTEKLLSDILGNVQSIRQTSRRPQGVLI